MNDPITLNGITLVAAPVRRQEEILTPQALDFLAQLHKAFDGRRAELMQTRQLNRARIANGSDPKFRPETKSIRDDESWKVAPIAPGLEDRRVEITGPTDRKMAINALNHSMFNLAHGYARDGMSAYVELQEAEFASEARGYTATKHQREVGTGYFDDIATVLNPNASTLALAGSTEAGQFH